MNRNVWFVTGASKGLGLALVKQLLASGYYVAATSRDIKSLEKEVSNVTKTFLPIEMDLVNEQSVQEAIEAVVAHFGQIDVIVNNAGYGQMGTLEKISDAEIRASFDVNVFGLAHVIRKAMPYLRKQKSGHIINISSIAGYTANFPVWGIYSATKFAVTAFTEALAADIKSFGIKATVVHPGYFKTNFLKKGSIAVPANPIVEYTEARQIQEAHLREIDDNQAGDPIKAANAMIKISEVMDPPLHLFLGQDAYDIAYKKMEQVKTDLEAWKDVTVSTALG